MNTIDILNQLLWFS